MKISRNEPCPCGSGRKYKHCCLPADRAKAAGARGADREALSEVSADDWEAGVFPLSIEIRSTPTRRNTVAMVTGGGLVLNTDLSNEPLGGVDEVADALAAAVRGAREATGVAPGTVWVRYAEVAGPLSTALEPDGVEVRVDAELPGLLDAARSLNREMVGRDMVPLFESAPSWREGWGLSGEACAALFDAAAAFYRASPWERLGDGPLMAVIGDREWTASVMGSAGLGCGIALFSDDEDYDLIEMMAAESLPVEAFRGGMITLDFDPADRLPAPARREIMASGWTVAGPDAYPHLYTLNTPAGGLDPATAADLTAILRAVPAFLADRDEEAESIRPGRVEVWETEDGDVHLEYLTLVPDMPSGPGYTVVDEGLDPDVEARLDEVFDRVFDALEVSTAVTVPVLDLALQLLTVYAHEEPDALLRAHGPDTFAAGAVHAALLWQSLWTRPPSAATVAEWFDVSMASVGARSRELRTVAEESGGSWDELGDGGLDVVWSDDPELQDLAPASDAWELHERLDPVVDGVRIQEHIGEGLDIDAFIADHDLHADARELEAVFAAGARDYLGRLEPGRADDPDRPADGVVLDDPLAFGYAVRAGLRAPEPSPAAHDALARYGLGLLLRSLPPGFEEPPYAAALPVAWLADRGVLVGETLMAAARLLAREPDTLRGVTSDELRPLLDAIIEDETTAFPRRTEAVLDLLFALGVLEAVDAAAPESLIAGLGALDAAAAESLSAGLDPPGALDEGLLPSREYGLDEDDDSQLELL